MSVRILKEASDKHIFGGKAANLAKLIQHDLPVPDGIAVGLDAFSSNGKLIDDAKDQIKQHITNNKLYAVRSSALAEDAKSASWAGQFETFLDTKADDVVTKIELCHASAKNRARAYAKDKDVTSDFEIAVVIQEMINPDYAGVLFTKDPISGKDLLVTEYVAGLGEELVSGRADPTKVVLGTEDKTQTPFDSKKLAELAKKVEQLFGMPQDIEWVCANDKIWLVQARAITATQKSGNGYYIGEPNDLFYWGPSRAQPMYMSDFMAAVEHVFIKMANDPKLPDPPKTLVLFDEGKMVWLNNAKEFTYFTEQAFEIYEKLGKLDEDITNWRAAGEKLDRLDGDELTYALVNAWSHTEFAEFSLYGAETTLIKRLGRFDAQTRQDIWGSFTVPDKPTFLASIDNQLSVSKDVTAIAKQYFWIKDGYDGLSGNVTKYFEERRKIVGNDETSLRQNLGTKRDKLIQKLKLTNQEVAALTLARKLAEFMDDRKAWMMQTRHLLIKSVGVIEHGWVFSDGIVSLVNDDDTHELWQRYVEFKAATNAVTGIVASNGNKHFMNGEVVIVTNPTDIVENGRILVVPFTSPSYVPLMRKAKALVTDHGGMMSHAAIVAREFNLPCIVGTKQATKVLKNGDKVVLDLVKGEVNK